MADSIDRRHDRKVAVAALIVAASLCAAPRQALAQDAESRPWSEMLIVVGHDVALSLPDGYVEGRAVAVTRDALEMEIRETSNAAAYPKGPASIGRSLISVVLLRRTEDGAPGVAAQTVGQAAVFGGLAGLGSRRSLRDTIGRTALTMGAAAAGAIIGRRLDRRQVETVIRIRPAPAGSADDPLRVVVTATAPRPAGASPDAAATPTRP